jgi:Tat protein translocase TatB subunit
MFGIGMPELLMILAVALIIIGPKKLPELAKTLGRALGEFKRATNDLKESIQMETGLDDVGDEFHGVERDIKDTTPLSDEAPAADTSDTLDDSSEPTMSKVKEAFDELNTDSPSSGRADHSAEDNDAAQEKNSP